MILVNDSKGKFIIQYRSEHVPKIGEVVNVLNTIYKVLDVQHTVLFNRMGEGLHTSRVELKVDKI